MTGALSLTRPRCLQLLPTQDDYYEEAEEPVGDEDEDDDAYLDGALGPGRGWLGLVG